MRLSIVERVDAAVDEIAAGHQPPSAVAEQDAAMLALPDDARLTYPHRSRPRGAFFIYDEDDPDELFDSLQLFEIGNVFGPGHQIARVLKHERQHREAALLMGAEGVDIGLQLRPEGVARRGELVASGSFYFAMPYELRLTKLGFVAFLLYPEPVIAQASSADLVSAANIGYPGGVAQVGELVVEHNRREPDPYLRLPVPMTYKGPRA